MKYHLDAGTLDLALAGISDVPIVENEDETLVVTFTGKYGNPVNDLVDFLGALQAYNEEAADNARQGLYWQDGFYGGHGKAEFNGLLLVGTSRYQEGEE